MKTLIPGVLQAMCFACPTISPKTYVLIILAASFLWQPAFGEVSHAVRYFDPEPNELLVSDVTDSSAVISWDILSDRQDLRYRAGTNAPWVELANATSPVTLPALASGTRYRVQLRSYLDGELVTNLRNTFTTSGEPACSAPSLVAVNNITDETASVALPPGPGNYHIWYRAGTGAPWTQIDDVTVDFSLGSNRVALNGLASGMQYTLRVYRICGELTSAPFVTQFTTLGPTRCLAPDGEVEVITENSATLSFPTVPGSYSIWYRAGALATWTKMDDIVFPVIPVDRYRQTLFSLSSGTTYTARIYRNCDLVVSDPLVLNFTTEGPSSCPAPQTDIGLITTSSAQLQLPSRGGNYSVWYRAGIGAPWTRTSVEIPVPTGAAPAFFPLRLTGLATGTRYNVRVYEDCAGITSLPYTTSFTTAGDEACPAPEAMVEDLTETSLSVVWPARPGSYEVWYRAGTGSSWVKQTLDIPPLPLENNRVLLQDLSPGTRYVVRLYAICDGITSLPYIEVVRTPGASPCSPPELAVGNITPSSAIVNWTGTGDSYVLRYRSGLFGAWTRISGVSSPFSLEDLDPGTEHFVRVFSVCNGVTSSATGSTFITEGEAFCEAPGSLVNNVTETSASVIWEAADDVSYEFRYRAGPTSEWIDVDNPVSPVTLSNLAPGTIYNTQLYALCGNQTSEASSTDFTTAGTVSCDRPDVIITDITDTQATVSWTGTGDIDNLWYRPGVLSPWTQLSNVTSPVIIDELFTGLEYQVRVFLECGEVSSAPGTVFFTTTGESSCETPQLTIDEVTTSAATVSWSSTSDLYTLWYREPGDSWTVVNDISVTAFSIPNLQPNTDYELRLYAICGDINARQVAASFTTLGTEMSRSSSVAEPVTGAGLSNKRLIYPVPATDALHILMEASDPIIDTRVFDMSGQLMRVPIREELGEQVLDVNLLPVGSYLLTITDHQGRRVERFTIVR